MEMEPIRVRSYPRKTFDSLKAAAAHARSHPRLPVARADAARLEGAVFVDACWTLSEWVIRFDCDLSLRVWVEQTQVCWSLTPSVAIRTGDEFQRVGAAPAILDWSGIVGLSMMDCSALVAKRRGASFANLLVYDEGLYIYLCGHLILMLCPVERLADGQGILYVCEDE